MGNKKLREFTVPIKAVSKGGAIIEVNFILNEYGDFNITSQVKYKGGEGASHIILKDTGAEVSENMGIKMQNGEMSVVIPRGTKFPCHVTKEYTNSDDNQTLFEVEIYKGNSNIAANNELLRRHVVNMKPCPRG